MNGGKRTLGGVERETLTPFSLSSTLAPVSTADFRPLRGSRTAETNGNREGFRPYTRSGCGGTPSEFVAISGMIKATMSRIAHRARGSI